MQKLGRKGGVSIGGSHSLVARQVAADKNFRAFREFQIRVNSRKKDIKPRLKNSFLFAPFRVKKEFLCRQKVSELANQ